MNRNLGIDGSIVLKWMLNKEFDNFDWIPPPQEIIL
jgi:hypothetical protein